MKIRIFTLEVKTGKPGNLRQEWKIRQGADSVPHRNAESDFIWAVVTWVLILLSSSFKIFIPVFQYTFTEMRQNIHHIGIKLKKSKSI